MKAEISIRSLHPALGAEVMGVDLSAPLGESDLANLRELWAQHHVLVFRNQSIDDAQHVRFSRHFGDLELLPEPDQRASVHPEIFRIANTDEHGRIRAEDDPVGVYLKIVEHWHTDSAYREVPSFGAILRALEVPPTGGETAFANLFLAYEHMPAALQARIQGKVMCCSYEKTRQVPGEGVRAMEAANLAQTPPVFHPLVRRHPCRENRLSLYLSPVNIAGVVGMPQAQAEGLVKELTDWATQDRFVYRHKWQRGDLVMWDNRCTMHCVSPYDKLSDRRVMHRTALGGVEPVVPAL